MSKNYRLKVRKIPLKNNIPIYEPNFPPLDSLYLDLLENKTKLKKNPPKPIFIREEIKSNSQQENFEDNDEESEIEDAEDKFVFNSLLNKYGNPDSEIEDGTEGIESSEGSKSERSLRDRDVESQNSQSSKHSPSSTSPSKPQPQYSSSSTQSQPQSSSGSSIPNVRTTYTLPTEQQEESEEDSEEKEKQAKADLLFKFMVLRRSYPNVEIQEFTEHSDLGTMKRVYDQIIRRVSLDSSVETYKQYLVGGFMIMEFMSVNWFGIDLQGFTQQQMRLSNNYDKLLLELGEKNYSPKGSRFPVEVRIVFMIMTNAALFYVQKSVFSGSGSDLFTQFLGGGMKRESSPRTFRGNSPTENSTPKSRMRGPSISPEEVEELARKAESSSEN